MPDALQVLIALLVFFGSSALLALGLRLVGTASVWIVGLVVLVVLLVLQGVVGGRLLGYLALAFTVALCIVGVAVGNAAHIDPD